MPERLSPAQLTDVLTRMPDVGHGPVGQLQIRLQLPSFAAAAELIARVAATAEELDHHPDIDLRWRTVTFGLSTHSASGVTSLDIDLARRILELGASLGADPLDPPSRVEIAVDAADPQAVRLFWRTALGYTEQTNGAGGVELHHPDGAGPVVWFQQMDPPRPGRGRVHLDVYVPAEDAERRVADVIASGGRLVSADHAPHWWVLADPEGNEVCICV